MMAQAKAQDEARKNGDQQAAGAVPPVGGDGNPPEAYQPPTGPGEPDGPAAGIPTSDQAFNDRFADLVDHATVLKGEPERPWNRSGKITTDEELAAAPADSRAILERLVKVAGPLRAKEIHGMLIAGGDWGPAVGISAQALHKLLKEPGGTGPAAWLAPRAAGQPYNHRDNVSG
jgi:hypothetical protein